MFNTAPRRADQLAWPAETAYVILRNKPPWSPPGPVQLYPVYSPGAGWLSLLGLRIINVQFSRGRGLIYCHWAENNYRGKLFRTCFFVSSDIFSCSHFFSFLLSFSKAYSFLSASVLVLAHCFLPTGLPFPFVFSPLDRSGISSLFFSPSICDVVQGIPNPAPQLLIFHFSPAERLSVFCVQKIGSYNKVKIQNCLVWLNINKYNGGYIVYLFISISPSLF